METFQKDIQLVKFSCNLRSQMKAGYFIKYLFPYLAAQVLVASDGRSLVGACRN